MRTDPLKGLFKRRLVLDLPGGEPEHKARELVKRGLLKIEKFHYVRCVNSMDHDQQYVKDHQCSGKIPVSTPASTILDTRIEKIGEELTANENCFTEVERQLTRLAEIEIDTEWIVSVLRDFDSIWEVMTPENRYRLIHALIQEVIVDEKAGSVTARLIDFDTGESISGMNVPTKQDKHVSKADRKRRLSLKPKPRTLDNEC